MALIRTWLSGEVARILEQVARDGAVVVHVGNI